MAGYPEEYIQVMSEFNSKGVVLVTGTFDNNMADWAPKQLKDAWDGALDNNQKYVLLLIDSTGGSTRTLQRFVSFMSLVKPHPDYKYVGYVSVEAFSAAFELLQYCDWRVAHAGASLLLHYGRIEMTNWDQAMLYENHSQALAYEKSRIKSTVDLVCKRSGLSTKKVHELCKRDLPFMADQAKEMGFIDEIVDNLPFKSEKPDYKLNLSL